MKRLLLSLTLLACWAHVLPAQSTIFLVRHAEKAESADGDPKDPELSDTGRARAESLRTMLKDAGITAVYATEFKRTQQTANSVAAASDVKPTIVPAKETGALIAKIKEARGNVLVVGHSNTLPEVIKALGVLSPVTIEETDYDNLFVVIPGTTPQLIRLHFR